MQEVVQERALTVASESEGCLQLFRITCEEALVDVDRLGRAIPLDGAVTIPKTGLNVCKIGVVSGLPAPSLLSLRPILLGRNGGVVRPEENILGAS